MLYLIGTGLYKDDISIGALEKLKRCSRIYLENYTSKAAESASDLEISYGVSISPASRDFLESTDTLIKEAEEKDVALLVAGSPLFATTHTDILLRARKYGVEVKTFHSSGIHNAIGSCGLYSYAFGRTVSIPFFEDSWRPTSFYKNICNNIRSGLHTLCLLDIRVDSHSEKFMSPKVAISQLLECESIEKESIIHKKTSLFVISRFGHPDEKVLFGTIESFRDTSFGRPLHSLIVPAQMDTIESEHVDLLFR